LGVQIRLIRIYWRLSTQHQQRESLLLYSALLVEKNKIYVIMDLGAVVYEDTNGFVSEQFQLILVSRGKNTSEVNDTSKSLVN
jgi:hypothetical protein